MKKTKRGQLQISFAWIFAIIVGAVILFLAIYTATKVIKIGDTAVSAKTGKEISVLLNPLETGFETSVVTLITMPVETRIYNQCSISGNFGRQIIKISQKSLVNGQKKILKTGLRTSIFFLKALKKERTSLFLQSLLNFLSRFLI